jgi:hypothetical protein
MYFLIGLILTGVALYLLLKGRAPGQIFSLFNLSEGKYELVSSDLGKGHPRRRLGGFGLGGEPDAIFKGKRTGQIVVGEYKNRKHKGLVRRREFFQVQLYLGLIRESFGTQNVVGILAFNDGLVQIAYDHEVFLALVGLRGEVLTSLQKKKAQDKRPLHRRINIASRNQRIRFDGR